MVLKTILTAIKAHYFFSYTKFIAEKSSFLATFCMLKAHFSLLRIKQHQQYVQLDISLSVENEICPVVWK